MNCYTGDSGFCSYLLILFANKTDLILQNNINWLCIPVYFVFIIIRVIFNFYPYPFINVSAIGISKYLLIFDGEWFHVNNGFINFHRTKNKK
jgi:hypothetical protein